MRSGAVAFISGAGRGIGRATAYRFARAGARVVVAARTAAEIEAVAAELSRIGATAIPIVCDVASSDSVTSAFAQARERLGPIDVLVNNAGIAPTATLAALDEATWSRTIEVNLTGTYRCTRAALPSMIERGYGRVINIASIASRIGGAYLAAYSASKHGVLGFTRSVALEVADKGVTVNAICPGFVATPMTEAGIANIVARTGRSPDEARRILESQSPQRRLIDPDEVAAITLFLASDEAHGINGQAINVDGGQVMS